MAGAATAVVALTAGLTACGGDSLEDDKGSDGGGKGKIVVGSARFTEQKVLAELYAGVLRDAGYDASVKTVQNREVYEPELKKGTIDVAPEYAATLTEFLNLKKNGADAKPVASSDLDATYGQLTKLAGGRGLKALPAGEAVDQNAFAVTRATADRLRLKKLSDITPQVASTLTLGAGAECPTRPFCQPGLEKTYGLKFKTFRVLDSGGPKTLDALTKGDIDIGLVFSSDGAVAANNLVVLEDWKFLLESALGKDRILEIYLNKVYFGDGLYGAEAASGVIQIFTKRGVAGPMVWSAQLDQGFDRVLEFGTERSPSTTHRTSSAWTRLSAL